MSGSIAASRMTGARDRKGTLIACILLVFLAFTAGVEAAPPSGIVEGIARDAQGRPVAGVTVRLQAPDGHVAGETTTAADDGYRFTGVPPGSYSVIGAKEGFQAGFDDVTVLPQAGASADLALGPQKAVEEVTVIAKRLEEARIAIQPQIGASSYSISSEAIANQPGGDNNSINQVLLQTPGIAQDSNTNGTIHVRNEHLNVQYRINGVILPEGVSFFGQAQGLSPRFVRSMDLITGALPAEYGLRTAGVVDIRSKSGLFANGGSVGVYGGSHATVQPSVDYGGSAGSYNYFVSGDFLRSDLGVNAVTPAVDQIHDDMNQGHGFAYLDKIIDASSKATLIAGSFVGRFQIPNNPGQSAVNFVNSVDPASFNSAAVDERQAEQSHFAVGSYLRSQKNLDFEVSAFTKYSNLHFFPDRLADLAFNGVGQEAIRRSIAAGVQADGSYKLTADHTLRAGVIVTGERVTADTTSLVEATGASDDTAFTIIDNHAKTGMTYSAYLEDEWHVLPTVTLNYGGRFDEVNTFTTANQISPRVNAVWKATPATTVHAGYASYFTPPPFELVSTTSIGLFANTTNAPPSTANSSVKPERAQYFDIGVAQDVLPGLKIGVDAYYKYSRNLIDEGQFGAPVIQTPFNFHIGINRGVELTTTYENGPFSYYGNLAIAQQKAEGISSAQFNFSPNDLDFIATHRISTDHTQIMTASAGIAYLWRDTRFSADLIAGTGVRTTRDDGPPNGGTVPSYEQVNLGVSHRFAAAPRGPITVRFDVINLFDEVYLLRSQTGIGVFAPQFGPRRTVFAGITKEF